MKSVQSIDERVLAVKINQTYRDGMTDNQLYEITRGIWKLDKTKLDKIQYVFGVYHGIVKEVYEVAQWQDAGSTPYEFREHKPETLLRRSEFVGKLAPDDIRDKYLGKRIDLTYQAVNYYNC
jgi:hypothetical protein